MAATWVSFEDIKKAVSLKMVLDHYRIKLREVGADSLRGQCPLPMHGADHKNRASFSATLTKGVGGVWACQSTSCTAARGGKKGGNALDLVATMEGCSIRDAAVKLQEWFAVPSAEGAGANRRNEKTPEKPADLVPEEKSETPEEGNKPLTFELRGIDPTHPYLKDRGITEDMARAFGVGFFAGRGSMSGRVVFPIHNERVELVAYVGRAIDESEPRYKFPAGFHKSLELYNLHRAIAEGNSRVVVVEGFFDCLKVDAAGFPCVALMGSSMSEAQEELLIRHFEAACIFLDGDEAGQQGAKDCLQRLGRRMFVWAPELPEGKQPDMLSTDEIQVLLKK